MFGGHKSALAAYEKTTFAQGPWRRDVFKKGAGPAVIVVHDIAGLNPLLIRFADRVAAAGMTVYMPLLFGIAGRSPSAGYAVATLIDVFFMRREFNIWTPGKSSPIVGWLRALARRAHQDCGGRGVGAIGMSLTGGFPIAMMGEPAVVAPVLAQPSIPVALFSKIRASGLDASPDEVALARSRFEAEDLSLLALRFKNDRSVPDARFATYRREFGERFDAIELEDVDAAPSDRPPHSVLTFHMREDGPTKAAEQRVIAFLKQRTSN